MENGTKLDFGMMGYCFKFQFQQRFKLHAPRVIPPSFENSAVACQPRASSKAYCVVWGSGDYCIDPEFDTQKLVPFIDDMPDLSFVKRTLFSLGANGACIKMLAMANRLDEDLRVFDLPSLGLKLICCPEPRPAALLQSTKERITIPLANDDNRLACTLLLAEKDFDLIQIQDIFGPVLILFHPNPSPRDFKIKHCLSFLKSYLGLTSSLSDELSLILQASGTHGMESIFQPNPKARKEHKKQMRGMVPPTDLGSHAPGKGGMFCDQQVVICAHPNCPVGNDSSCPVQFMRCGRCKSAFYCSKDCQKQHWRTHKVFCNKSKCSNK